jgi:DNA-binding IclR family transcriptional regulator
MKFIEYAQKLETLKYLAEHKRSGTPDNLAKKLNISERTVHRMVQQLREQGYHIIFNRWRRTYEVKHSEKNY